jgi:hypothetical protein
MKRLGFPLLVIAAVAAWHLLTSPQEDGRTRLEQWGFAPASADAGTSQSGGVERAFADGNSGVMLTAAGRVERLLSDDREGSRHQRFIVGFASGHTVLIAHNIDLAPRVDGIEVGDQVRVHGQYEWNEKGGVIHWTHHDPQGVHEPGWIEHDGRRYD